jgi:hypothetical protein
MRRRIFWWLSVLIVLAMTILGLYSGPEDFVHASKGGDRLLAVFVTIYGITGLISFYGMLRKRSWVMIPLVIFACAATFAGTFASIYYSPPDTWWISGITSAASCVALLIFVLFQVRREILRP